MARSGRSVVKPVRRTPSKAAKRGAAANISLQTQLEAMQKAADDLAKAIDELTAKDEMNPGDMLELQFMMNLFAQLTETTSAVMAAMQSIVANVIRTRK